MTNLDGDPIHHVPIQHKSLLLHKLNHLSLSSLFHHPDGSLVLTTLKGGSGTPSPLTPGAPNGVPHTASIIHGPSRGGGATDVEALGRTNAPQPHCYYPCSGLGDNCTCEMAIAICCCEILSWCCTVAEQAGLSVGSGSVFCCVSSTTFSTLMPCF
jgi:hypothetical protein